ncbi:MAG: hypothetical protein ABI742_04550 [Gemmatimonadota bacterium]
MTQAAWQTQLGPQPQASPHSQPARRAVPVFWQPQVQEAPEQLLQVQVVGSVDILDSSCSGEPPW